MSSQVRSELERKKARLAALKEEKARKERMKQEQNENVPPSIAGAVDIRHEADQILKSLNLNEEVKQLGVLPTEQSSVSPAPKTKNLSLTISQLDHTSIPPEAPMRYSKEIQTVESRDSFDDDINDGINVGLHDEHDWSFDPSGMYDMSNYNISPGVDFPNVSLVQPKLSELDEQMIKQKKKKSSFTPNEVDSIEKSDSYLGFLNRAINRVISEMNTPNIIFKDYTGADLEDEFDLLQKPFMTEGPVFYDEYWCKDRCISSLNWSSRHSELIAVSYMENANALHQPPGVVLLWNTRLEKSVPETVLHSQSPVTEVIFAPFQPNLLIGGTYEGIVNIWDTRIYRRLPVMRTNLANPHTQPIRALQAGGSTNAPTLLSLSSDGMMAKWSLDMLSQPIESADLNLNAVRTTTPICMSPVMNVSTTENVVPKYLVGVESGDVMLVKPTLQSANGTGPMTEILTSQFNHSGPIYSIKAHPYIKPPLGHADCDFSDLFLTTSEDSTVQLRTLNSPPQTNLLHTFSENFKPVRHCSWSPVHPGMFASVDISSELFLWNINLDSEVPISRARCDRRGAFFSQCLFNPNGLSIACGDSLGHLQLFTLNEQRVMPKLEDWSNFKMWVNECSSRVTDAST